MCFNRFSIFKIWSVFASIFFMQIPVLAEVFPKDPLLVLDNIHNQKKRDGELIRFFLRDLIYAVSKPKAERVFLLQHAIAKNPEVFHRMVRHHNIAYWLDVLSIADIPVNLKSSEWWLAEINRVIKKYDSEKVILNYLEDYASRYTSLWEFVSYQDRMLMLERIPAQKFVLLAEMISSSVDSLDFSEEPCLQMLKDPQRGLSVSYMPEAFLDLAYLLIDQYFNKHNAQEKARIISELLNLKPHSSKVTKLAAFLNASGPVAQKFFQLMGEHVEDESIRLIVNELKTHVKPFSYEEAKKIVEDSYNKPIAKMFFSFEQKPLAAATIAQVHLASFKKNGKKVVVKIKRPGVEIKAKKEIRIIRSLTQNEGILNIIEQLEQVIDEETDLRIEAKHLKQGAIYNSKRKGIHAVMLDEKYPPTPSVLIMELAKGKSIDKFEKLKDLKLKSIGLKRLYSQTNQVCLN